jgi:serine/threonine protein kinase
LDNSDAFHQLVAGIRGIAPGRYSLDNSPIPDTIKGKYNIKVVESIKDDESSHIAKVLNQDDGKFYILKQIKNKLFYNPKIAHQIRSAYSGTDEARSIAVPLDVSEDEQYFYEIMHYFEAWTIVDILSINQNGVYGSLFRRWARDLISLLRPLHRRHLVHCDINPFNILVTKDIRVQLILIDFSSAISLNDTRKHEYIQVCPGFTAPEIIKYGTYSGSVRGNYGAIISVHAT